MAALEIRDLDYGKIREQQGGLALKTPGVCSLAEGTQGMGAEQNKVEDSLRVLTGLFGPLPSVEGLGSRVSFSLSPWRALSCVDQYTP